MSGPQIVTLGCRLNMAESAGMRALAADQDDLVIVNSCAVTNEAVRRTRQAIRRARRRRPEARIVVTGCAAEIDPASFAAMPEVSQVVSNAEKYDFSAFQDSVRAEPVEALPFSLSEEGRTGLRQAQAERKWGQDRVPAVSFEKSRAFVEVQNGCDHRCTFCIIPYGRGNSRSVPAGLVIESIQKLVDAGAREVVLTGVDVTSYGPDLPGSPTLGMLVERILRHVPQLPRLRLSSLDSVEIDERLEDMIVSEKRFMPHLHMSFQSGDDMILKRMKRRHSRAQAIATVQRLKARRPDIAVGADLIAGFPTETEDMAANSERLIEECDIVMGHIFPFSPRAGTPAAKMPQVPPPVVAERAARLRAAGERRKAAWLKSLVGTRQQVLAERGGAGHAENFAVVRLCSREGGNPGLDSRLRGSTNEEAGTIVPVIITGVEGATLTGAPA